ncbi:HD domain-containing protein [Brevibacillus sp. NPDC058079]|uniref:HD domain-containing protein n=1 Tax=Brevibacillus sp. NPDC058079 TaxID=3346330 RepID=UPI0036F1274C
MTLIEKARIFATKAHNGQTRKSTGAPYIVHPIRVATILEEAEMSPVVIAAGYLHDTVEDTDVTIEAIQFEFGQVVSDLVAFNTEDKSKSWQERKEHTIEHLKFATLEQKALVIADKFANLLELIQIYPILGEDIWKSFNRGKEDQYWYFSGVAKSGKENLPLDLIPAFFLEYEEQVELFFKTGA